MILAFQKTFWLPWPSEELAKYAVNKTKLTSKKFGFPEILIPSEVDYMDLPELSHWDYLFNLEAAFAWQNRKNIRTFRTAFNMNLADSLFTDSVAFFLCSFNRIILTNKGLQWPLAPPKSLDALNYGSLGTILSHELIHPLTPFGNLYPTISLNESKIFMAPYKGFSMI